MKTTFKIKAKNKTTLGKTPSPFQDADIGSGEELNGGGVDSSEKAAPAKINASGANSSGKAAKDKINGSGGNLSGKAAQAKIDNKVNNDMITDVEDVCADAPSVSQLLGQARQGKKGKRKASKAVGIIIKNCHIGI